MIQKMKLDIENEFNRHWQYVTFVLPIITMHGMENVKIVFYHPLNVTCH